MTPCERLALSSLSHCSFGMSGSRRFVLNVSAKPDDYELTARQKWNLWRLAWRYRRQVPREVSDMALELSAGAEAPPIEKAKRAVVERKTKDDLARAAMERPIRFGDLEMAAAGRRLAKK